MCLKCGAGEMVHRRTACVADEILSELASKPILVKYTGSACGARRDNGDAATLAAWDPSKKMMKCSA